MIRTLDIFSMKNQRSMKVSKSKIKTLFKGEFVLVDMVDQAIELTVEDNVYSRSESLELLAELQSACRISKIANNMIGMKGIDE